MNLAKLLGVDTSSVEGTKKTFLKMIGQIKPMMEERGIKSIVINYKEDGELDLQMLDYCVMKREQDFVSHISTLNNKLLNK